jgi:hypothetical protein
MEDICMLHRNDGYEDPEQASIYHVRDLTLYFEAQWALIALHIIQKTPTAPAFIFATFEQAENILTATSASVEDVDGAVVKPQPNPTTPAQTYMDSPTDPQVSIVGSTYCTP